MHVSPIFTRAPQLQIAAAVRTITSGAMEKLFAERAEEDGVKQVKGLSRKLLQARKLLSDAVTYLTRRKDSRYTELYARELVDMATAILIGYLLIKQTQHSARKKIIAKRFITRMLPQLKMNYRHIASGDNSTLKHFDTIVPLQTQ